VSAHDAERLRIATVYRHFNRSGSISSSYADRAEWLAQVEDVTAVCSASTREATTGPLRFETVEPLVQRRGRFSYAVECASFALRAERLIRSARSRFDVVHVDGIAAFTGDLVTVHAVRGAELEHYFTNVEPEARLRRALAPVARPQNGVVLLTERRLFRPPYPLCLAMTDEIAGDLQERYGVPGELIEVLPRGVDSARFCFDSAARDRVRARFGTAPDRLVLLFVGDDFERKGLERAIGAVASARTRPELWIAGGGAADRYRATAAELGVTDRIRFLGHVSGEGLVPLLSAADALLLPSRQDAWGQTVLEAMASGRVVLVSRFSGVHKLVEDGSSGFVLDGPGSIEQMASLIDGPVSEPELRAAVGDRAVGVARRLDLVALHRRFRDAVHRAYARRQAREGRPAESDAGGG
jgi:glycosyltransferase involved in cell wall biosynthesis